MMERKFWWEKPLRIIQTVLREPDIENYDVTSVLSYLKKVYANVIVVNVGGIVAFYPTNVFLHYKNPFMKGRDFLKELIHLCHSNDIRVIGRVDFRGARKEMFNEHPDWFSYDLKGNPRVLNGLYLTCANSPYRNEYALEVIQELLSNYDLDGIWENAASFGGLCYCPVCKDKFKNAIGSDLPKDESWEDPIYGDYLEWRYSSVLEHSKKIRTFIKSFGEDKAYTAEFPGLLSVEWTRRGGQDINLASSLFDFLVTPCFVISRNSYGSPFYPAPIWGALEAGKYLYSIGDGRTSVILFSHLEQTSRYTAEPKEELKVWMYQAIGSGSSMWDCTFVGANPENFLDKRNIDIIKEIYSFYREKEEYYYNLVPISDVALIYSRKTQDKFGDDNPIKDNYCTNFRGYELALLEAHMSYDIIPDTSISLEILKKYKCIILPNLGYISDELAQILTIYVKNGGGLIATFETSLYNEKWEKLNNFKLSKIFDVDYLGINRGPLPYSYQLIRENTSLTKGLEDTKIIALNGLICIVKPSDNLAEVPLTLIPEIYPQPPEYGWIETIETSIPTVILNKVGNGRVVYFPTQIDRLYYSDHHPDYGILLKNAVKWVSKDFSKIEVNAPVSLYVTPFIQKDRERILIHLINTASGPSRPIFNISEVKDVSIIIKEVKEPKSVYLLRGNQSIGYNFSSDRLNLKIPVIREYDVLVLEF